MYVSFVSGRSAAKYSNKNIISKKFSSTSEKFAVFFLCCFCFSTSIPNHFPAVNAKICSMYIVRACIPRAGIFLVNSKPAND